MENIESLLNNYHRWLKEKTIVQPINGWTEVTTPYLDIHNDYLQLYIKLENEKIIISDGGYILSDLNIAGCPINTDRRKQLLEMTLRSFGVENKKDELITEATSDNFPIRKHNIIQAMLSIHDLFYTVAPVSSTVFADDVSKWLVCNNIRNISQAKFTGKSGFDYVYDFVIPKSEKENSDRFIKTVNILNNEKVKTLAFSWLDITEVRGSAKAYTIINDNNKVQQDAINALKRYNISPVLWSERDRVIEELSA